MSRRKRIYGKRRKRSPFKANNDKKNELANRVAELKSEGKTKEETKQILKKETGSKAFDRLQTKLSFLGVVFPPADAVNALVSMGRSKYAAVTGDEEAAKKHKNASLWNLAAVVPGVGEMKMTSKATKQLDNLADVATNPTVRKIIQNVGNIGYWTVTAKQVAEDVSGTKKETKKEAPNWAGANVKQVTNKYGV